MSGFEILKIGNKKYVEYITDIELVDEMILGMIISKNSKKITVVLIERILKKIMFQTRIFPIKCFKR